MTTNVNVDVRELFVMPKVRPVTRAETGDAKDLLQLTKAHELIRGTTADKDSVGEDAIDFVRKNRRSILVGDPGGGKSTFLEWLQIQIAGAEEELISGDEQAMPLLLRIRQLDPLNLPDGKALISKATASEERAKLMPKEWIDRQIAAGRILFLIDGLDEVDAGATSS